MGVDGVYSVDGVKGIGRWRLWPQQAMGVCMRTCGCRGMQGCFMLGKEGLLREMVPHHLQRHRLMWPPWLHACMGTQRTWVAATCAPKLPLKLRRFASPSARCCKTSHTGSASIWCHQFGGVDASP